MSILTTRRSIRKFTDEPLTKEQILTLLDAAMHAPSAKNMQPWEFIVVTDPEIKQKVSQCSIYGGFTAEAPCAIVTLADASLYRGNDPWWCEDLSAATQNILLSLEEQGLGGCWIGIWPDEERVQKLRDVFGLDAHLVPFSIIACGHKNQQRQPNPVFNEAKIHWEKY